MDFEKQVKVCVICHTEKFISEFHKSNCGKFGVRTTCKECRKPKKELLPPNIRRCIKCGELKNVNEYYSRNDGSIRNVCKICTKINDRSYRKTYRKNNSHIMAWRDLLKRCVRRMSVDKNDKTVNILGYSAEDLKVHLEKQFADGMSWDNHGEWHIDHIKPVSSFEKFTHPSIVNSLDNLRPMWATTREINGIIYEGNLNKYIY